MKLLGVVSRPEMSPTRPTVFVDGAGMVPVEGDPPRPGLLELDCPGLTAPTRVALLRWLERDGLRLAQGTATKNAPAGALDAVPAACWRVITFGEAARLPNFAQLVHWAADASPPREITGYLASAMPALLKALDSALQAQPEGAQLTALEAQTEPSRTLSYVVWGMIARNTRHASELSRQLDATALEALRARRGLVLEAWVAAAAAMSGHAGRVAALAEYARRIPPGPDASAQVAALLDAVAREPTLRAAIEHAPTFWAPLGPLLDLSATLHEGELDVSDAEEVLAVPSWELWRARRVGRIKPGRKALVVRRGSAVTYVRGTRALFKQVIDAGGRLRHHGVTLTYPTASRPLAPMLVQVERIDTLAYVDPDHALALLGDRAPPEDHVVYQIAERARTDAPSARVLADVLIELAVGIDADVARKLARARRRG